jgi:hypothetical protein
VRLVLGVVVGLAGLAAVRPAAAREEDEALRLRWEAPAGCPSVDDVRAATLRGAGEARAKSVTLEADAHVERVPGEAARAWRVRLRTRRGAATGEREIEASTCHGVAEATAVILALALVPPGSAPPEETRDQPLVTVAMPPPRDAPAAPVPAPAAPRTPGGPHLFALGAGGSGDVSTLPRTTLGGSLTLAITPGRWRFELDGRMWASQSQSRAASDAGARFSMTSVGGRGCWTALRAGSLDLAPCLGADVHFVSAPGYGADTNFDATAQWVTLDGGALGRVGLTSWLAVRTRLDAFVPLTRPTFVVEGEGSVHRPPTLGAAASLGVEVLFL